MTSSSFTAGFPERLRASREKAGLTLRDLGVAADINYTQISRYEQGLAFPRPAVLNRMAEALGVPADALRYGSEHSVQILGPDGAEILTLFFSPEQFAQVEAIAELDGLSVPEAIKKMILDGAKFMQNNSPPLRRVK